MEDTAIGDLTASEIEEALGPAPVDKLKVKGRPKGGVADPEREAPKRSRSRRPSKLPLPAPEPAQIEEIQRFSRTHAMGLCNCLLEMAHTKNMGATSRIKAITTLLDLAGFTLEGKRSPSVELAGMSNSDFKATFKRVIDNNQEKPDTTNH